MTQMTQCPAEYHAHLEDQCFSVLFQCVKEEGHDMRGWHRNADNTLQWDSDYRLTCPLQEVDLKMSLRKPGSRQRQVLEDMLDGSILTFDPMFAEFGPGPLMTHGNIQVVLNRKLVVSLFKGGYIRKLEDTLGRGGWVVTQAAKEAMKK